VANLIHPDNLKLESYFERRSVLVKQGALCVYEMKARGLLVDIWSLRDEMDGLIGQGLDSICSESDRNLLGRFLIDWNEAFTEFEDLDVDWNVSPMREAWENYSDHRTYLDEIIKLISDLKK